MDERENGKLGAEERRFKMLSTATRFGASSMATDTINKLKEQGKFVEAGRLERLNRRAHRYGLSSGNPELN